jgi:hypothetical protein
MAAEEEMVTRLVEVERREEPTEIVIHVTCSRRGGTLPLMR